MASGSAQVHYKQNRLKQLRAFCHAAHTGSVSAAADKIFLSQPTVSLQIQALEREFGTILFERRGPKIRLTPEGELLFELAKPLVEGMDELHKTFAAQSGRLDQGALGIAAGESTLLYILPEPMRELRPALPGHRTQAPQRHRAATGWPCSGRSGGPGRGFPAGGPG